MKTEIRATACCLCVVAMMLAIPSAAAGPPRFTRSVVTVDVPDVKVIDQEGREIGFREAMLDERPVFVEFIFATCTTICPVLSAGFASVQRKLGDDREKVRLVSITIDPEHDGPEELRAYLERYGAQSGWDFITGTRADIDRVMRGFDAYVPDKMSHRPITFIHAPGAEEWVRIDGFAGSKDLMAEVERALGDDDGGEGEHHEDN
jgi:protein SCO1/2